MTYQTVIPLHVGLTNLLTGSPASALLSKEFVMSLWFMGQDGSGKTNMGESGTTVSGSYLTLGARCQQLGNRWLQKLHDYGVNVFHMNKAMARAGEFEGFSETERDKLLRDLATIAQDEKGILVMGPARRIYKEQAPQEMRTELEDDPYFWAVEGCITEAINIVKAFDSNPVIGLMCDLDDQESIKTLRLFNRMRSNNRQHKKILASISFGNDEEIPLIQIADMCAFCCREIVDGDNRPPRPIVSEVYSIVTNNRPPTIQWPAIGDPKSPH